MMTLQVATSAPPWSARKTPAISAADVAALRKRRGFQARSLPAAEFVEEF
jgi:hypothetical protein